MKETTYTCDICGITETTNGRDKPVFMRELNFYGCCINFHSCYCAQCAGEGTRQIITFFTEHLLAERNARTHGRQGATRRLS